MALLNVKPKRTLVKLRRFFRVVVRAKDIHYLPATSKMMSALVLFAATGPFLFNLSSSAVAQVQQQDILRGALSLLVFGAFGWGQTAAFYFFGFSLIALGISLFYKIRVRFHLGTVLLVLVGLGFVIIGGNHGSFPGALPTVQATIHESTLVVVLFMFPLALFLLSLTLKQAGRTSLHLYTVAASIFSLVFLVVGGIVLVERFSLVGLFERVLLWNGQLWMELVCAYLIIDHFKIIERFKRTPLAARVGLD